jgi:hypothetical protein
MLDVDREAAAQASSSPLALALDAILIEKGESERALVETLDTQTWRRGRIEELLAAFRHAEGDAALVKLRARAIERLQAAIDLTLPKEQRPAVLGDFPVLLREALASRDGEIVAPPLFVRTLAKVRWNVIMGLPRLYALDRIEHRTYHGWYALHGDNGPWVARLDELNLYAALGGPFVQEARGVIGYRGGDPAGARRAFERADAARPSLHLRNMIRAAKRAEYTMANSPKLTH